MAFYPLVNGVLPPEIIPFSKSLKLELNKSLLNKSTIAQIVTVVSKYEICCNVYIMYIYIMYIFIMFSKPP